MKRWQFWVLGSIMGLFTYDGARGQSADDLKLIAINDPLYKAQGGKLNSDSWTYYFDRVPGAAVMPFENGLLVKTPDLLTPEEYLAKRAVILRRVALSIGCLQFPSSWGMNLKIDTGFSAITSEGSTKVSIDLSRTLLQVLPPISPGDCPKDNGSQVWARDESHIYICVPKTGGSGFQWLQILGKTSW